MNEFDYEQARMEALGNRISKLKKLGVCVHGHLQGPPGKPVLTCLTCGAECDSHEEVQESYAAAMDMFI